MIRWYFDNIPEFRPEVGFETTFDVQNAGRTFPHRWKVTEVMPNRKLVYNWTYDGYEGDSRVEFEVFEACHGTRLFVRAIVTEDFPDDIPEFRRESCQAGWEYFIKDRLKAYLDGN